MKQKLVLMAMALFMSVALMAERQTIQLRVPEMECGTCQGKVEKVLTYVKGIKDLKYDIQKRIVTVTYEDKQTTPEKIQEALLKELNYKSTVIAPKKEKQSEEAKPEGSASEKKGCSATCTGGHH